MKEGKITKILRAILPLILFLGILSPSSATAEENPQASSPLEKNPIVAEVNSEKIHRDTLERELRRHLKGKLAVFGEAEQHQLKKKMLGMMVTRRLLLQEAKAKKVLPGEKEVDDFFNELKASFPSVADFEKQLAQFGLTEAEFKQGLAEDLAIQYYLERVALKDLSVSDAEVKKEYQNSPDKYRMPEEVKVRHILIRLKEDASADEEQAARKKAEEVHQLALQEAADFASLARNHSEALNKGKGGALDFFTAEQMDPAFSDAAFKLHVGEVSEVVKTPYGFHVIKLEQKRGGELPPFEAVEKSIHKKLLTAIQQETLAKHVLELREKSKVIVYFQ